MVEDKAVIFKKSDVKDLREKLRLLCDDEKTVQSYKAVAKDFILGKYSWNDVVDKTVELYRGQ